MPTSKIHLIALFTKGLAMKDLEVLVPPKFMIFRRASFWTGTRKHIYTFFYNSGTELTVGTGLGLGWGWVGVGVGFGSVI